MSKSSVESIHIPKSNEWRFNGSSGNLKTSSKGGDGDGLEFQLHLGHVSPMTAATVEHNSTKQESALISASNAQEHFTFQSSNK